LSELQETSLYFKGQVEHTDSQTGKQQSFLTLQ